MDNKAMQSHGHNYNEHPHNAGLQQEEHHHDHEKKSVLKKVKAKAKKIKDTITKHGHHDPHEDRHIPDDHDLDQEEEEEEEEMVQDPEIHGAPIYDSAAVTSGTMPGQVKTSERPRVNFGGANVMGEKPHHEPRVVVVSPATEMNHGRSTDPARTFVGAERAEQPNVNLVRPMGLEADPHAPGNRPGAFSSANYQTKVTDPTGAGGAEMDINPVQKSLERMTIHNEPIPEPKVLPTIAESQYPSASSNRQFVPEISTATKTHYPSAEPHGHNLPQLSSEIKTHYPKSHDQVMPNPYSEPKILPTVTETQYPSAGIHQQSVPELTTATQTHYPYAESHGQNLPQLSGEIRSHYPKSHDQVMSDCTPPIKTHEPYPSAGVPIATKTHCPSTGIHAHVLPELPVSSEPKPHYPSVRTHDQFKPQHSSATETHYPSAGSHGQFAPEFSTQLKTGQALNNPSHTRVEEQPHQHYESMDQQSNQNSYTDRISSATSAITDTAIGAKNAVASKLGYGEIDQNAISQKPQNQGSYTEKISSAAIGAKDAVASTAIGAKNAVASKIGYGETDQNKTFSQKPQSQGSYTEKITSTAVGAKDAVASTAVGAKDAVASTAIGAKDVVASTAIGAKNAVSSTAIGAKNAVASTLGYGETEQSETTRENPPTQSSYTEKISSATSAIADKAASAKNTVASKLGFGGDESGERDQNAGASTNSGSAVEHGTRIAESLTEKLAPVYRKAGTGSGVKSQGSESGVFVEQDKGVSVKDYWAEKLRPGDEDRALSEVISETLHKRDGDQEEDAVHKRSDERRRVPLGKVTESEEVKRRLGGEDEKTERMYEERYVNTPGEGVVDKLKGMVGSWFTTPEDNNNKSSQGGEDLARNSSVEVEQVNQATGERRLQGSSN